MPVTIDGVNLLITFDAIGTFQADRDLYSDWKEWVLLSDNMKFPQAFDTAAGDATSPTQSIAPYFFLRNDLGWRIKPFEADGDTEILGNLYPRASTIAMIIPTVGAFTSHVTREISPQALEVNPGLSTQEQEDVADAVWDEIL